MSFLSPLGFFGLISIPVLLWLWRMTATRHQTRVSSLIPFEHLLRRQPKRKARLIVNALFWLQLAALLGLTLGLARPYLWQRHPRLVLAILDTSASMGARWHGARAFDRARQALQARVARKAPRDHVLLVTTSPLAALTPEPTSDGTALQRALDGARVSDGGGTLWAANQLGAVLLGAHPAQTWVATDEPAPAGPLEGGLQWMSVGHSLPNAAIVGVDVAGSLCVPAPARLMVTVQNFSTEAQPLRIDAQAEGRTLAEANETIAPRGRRTLALSLPEGTRGRIALKLTAPHDALPSDNDAWANLAADARWPIVVQSHAPAFTQAMSRWLGACEPLRWSVGDPPAAGPYLLVTDEARPQPRPPAATLRFLRSEQPPVAVRWMTQADHPIGAYLAPLTIVTASLNQQVSAWPGATPVVTALVSGRNVPVVAAQEHEAQRTAIVLFDPVGVKSETPLVVFLNTLRWLMGAQDASTNGDPIESNTLEPTSTWQSGQPAVIPSAPTAPAKWPLERPVLIMVLALLGVEWRLYTTRKRNASRA